jgi:hypothetical protein
MADFNIELSTLDGKKANLDTMSTNAADIKSNYDGSTIKAAKQGYDAVASKITTNMERLKNGYENSATWFTSYLSELEALEADLASFTSSTLTKPIKFEFTFEDIFGKVTMPSLKTGAEPEKTELTDIEAKKKKFMGDVNDPSQFYIDPAYSKKLARMTCFDNTTGEVLTDGAVLKLKPGETRILTVKLPDYCGQIDHVFRTTAQKDDSGVIDNRCDIDPDPNNVDYIRWEPGNPSRQFHYPSGNISTKFNTYDWIITGQRNGRFLASQTCEFQSHGTDSSGRSYNYRGKKAMLELNVVVE